MKDPPPGCWRGRGLVSPCPGWEQRGLLPPARRPGARSNNWANALDGDPSYRLRCLATERDVMTSPSTLRIMGCAELNNPRRTGASQNKIKDRNKRVHGEAWSSRLLARASSPPSPSLNGESDGYWLRFFHPQASPSRLITQPFLWATAAVNPVITWMCYGSVLFCRVAGNISSNGRVGLRSEYNNRGREGQRSILAARTTAARQPPALFGCFLVSFQPLCVVIQLIVCLTACVRLSVRVIVRPVARRDV